MYEEAQRPDAASGRPYGLLVNPTWLEHYDERLPNQYWIAGLMPYIKNEQIWKCPSDNYKPPTSQITAGNTDIISYLVNRTMTYNSGSITESARDVFRHTASFSAPTRTVLMLEARNQSDNFDRATVGDGIWTNGDYQDETTSTGWVDNCGRAFPGTATEAFTNSQTRHFEGSNWLAAVGHVKWLKGTSVSARNWNNPTAKQGTGQGTTRSEGALYSGPGQHALTFSPY